MKKTKPSVKIYRVYHLYHEKSVCGILEGDEIETIEYGYFSTIEQAKKRLERKYNEILGRIENRKRKKKIFLGFGEFEAETGKIKGLPITIYWTEKDKTSFCALTEFLVEERDDPSLFSTTDKEWLYQIEEIALDNK